jgi:rod shape-determining protein MreC
MRRHTFARSGFLNQFVAPPFLDGQGGRLILMGMSVVLILLSGLNPSLFEGPRTFLRAAVSPVLAVFGTPFIVAMEGLDYVYKVSTLQHEVADLRSKNAKLEEWYNMAQVLQAENTSLKDLLQVKTDTGFKTVTSRVIADVGGPYAQSLLISDGTSSGIVKGAVVLAGQGVLGRVTHVDEKTAEVLLLTDVNSRIPVRIDGTAVQAIAGGGTDGQIILDRLLDGHQVREGMRIMTSGAGGLFPPDLPVGIIGQINKNGDIIVNPYTDVSRLIYVRIIMPRTIKEADQE